MALMLSKTYDALIAAGAPEDKAREAAEEIASYRNRRNRMETDVTVIKEQITEIRQNMATTLWVMLQTWHCLAALRRSFA